MKRVGFLLLGALVPLATDLPLWQTILVAAVLGLSVSLIVEGGDR